MRTKQEKQKELAEWLFVKRRELEDQKMHTISQAALGRMVSIPQGSMSQYINGERLPLEENTDKIAGLFGPEIYDILEKPRRMPHDPMLVDIVSIWHKLDADEREEILKSTRELLNKDDS